MKSALFFDIDGTLVPVGDDDIPERVKQVLLEAKQKGSAIFINSGRSLGILQKYVLDFDFDGFVLGCGSTIIYHNQIVKTHKLLKEKQLELVSKIKEFELDAVLEGDEYVGFINNGSVAAKHLEALYRQNNCKVYDGSQERHEFVKCCIFYREEERMKKFKDYFENKYEIIVRSGFADTPYFFEVIANDVSKATGIYEVADMLNISLENCYGFGDSTNDLSMLQAVKHSIAMGNSDEIVKKKVEYVTGDCTEDGIEQALKHYHLI